jgi:hypothetical protein
MGFAQKSEPLVFGAPGPRAAGAVGGRANAAVGCGGGKRREEVIVGFPAEVSGSTQIKASRQVSRQLVGCWGLHGICICKGRDNGQADCGVCIAVAYLAGRGGARVQQRVG